MKVDLTKKPFNLNDEQISWVNDIKKGMSIDEKIGQLFLLVGVDDNQMYLDELLKNKPGGVMFRPLPREKVLSAHKYLQENSKIPLFLSANLEAGADGLIEEGTFVGNNMTIAATNDPKLAYRQGEVSIKESLEVGGNMAFAPVIDINYNFENPISNTRTYGDNVETIKKMSVEYVNGVQDNGGSVTIKHFPGDGCDGRDQHLATTINCLSFKDWENTYGEIYRANIENGATGMMVGHIALPSYFKEFNITDEDDHIPASLSKNLISGLVREKLNFNGLIMTDATLMAGFASFGKREDLVPMSIASGNDMFLFTKNYDEDFMFMKKGYENGVISDERLDDALDRILGLKAKLNFNKKECLFGSKVNKEELSLHESYKKEVAKKAITLVKDEQGLLPLKEKTKIGILDFTDDKKVLDNLIKELNLKGYETTIIEFGVGFEDIEKFIKLSSMSVAKTKELADVFMYVAKKSPASNKTSIRIEYSSFAGLDAPWFVKEIPTMYVSLGSPYHGFDFANVKTGINCYNSDQNTIKELVSKLSSNEFYGKSPVKLDYKYFSGDISPWK